MPRKKEAKTEERRLNLLIVTKGNTDGSLTEGDAVYWCLDGSLVYVNGAGWWEKDELDGHMTDFEFVVDKEREVLRTKNGAYIIVKKAER